MAKTKECQTCQGWRHRKFETCPTAAACKVTGKHVTHLVVTKACPACQ